MKRFIPLYIFFILLVTSLIIGYSYSLSDIIYSDVYKIIDNKIYATPTALEFKAEELLYNIKNKAEVHIFDTNNNEISKTDNVANGYTLKVNNITYDIVVLGDTTNDGNISLSDISALYNHYKKNSTLQDTSIEAGQLDNSNSITLGDVSKLYNFYKGKSPFTYYSEQDLNEVVRELDLASEYYENNPLSNKLGRNIINELNISNKKESDQIVVTHDGKIEAAISKNNVCYKKNVNTNTIIKIENDLCKADISMYASNNGRLHVSGNKIYNEYNQEVRLRGMGGGLGSKSTIDNPARGELNDESLATLRSWGANTFRFFATSSDEFATAYMDDGEAFLTAYKSILDTIIANDFYVIINWNPARSKTDPKTNECIEFFKIIANAYPNDPHIMFEVWNEPEADNTWADIKTHASSVIDEVKKISPDAIFLVGTPSHDRDINVILNDLLKYDNIIYTYHMYARAYTREYLNNLLEVINANVPVIVSEFGGAIDYYEVENMYAESYIHSYFNLFEKYNLSYIGFVFSTSKDTNQNLYGIVTLGNWKNDLPDYILKPIGKFMKKAISNNFKMESTLMKENNDTTGLYYRSNEWKDKITSIEFKKDLIIPDNKVIEWDLSFANDESVIGYLIPTDVSDRYKLVIASNGIINPYMNMDYMFAGMANLKSIDFTNLNARFVKSMNHTFDGDTSLESLDLSSFNTSLLTEMNATFSDCRSLTSINLENFTPKLKKFNILFYNCESLTNLDLTGFDVTEVKNYVALFKNNTSLKTLNISTWNPNLILSTQEMFSGTTSLESVDMSLMNIDNSVTLTDMFKNTKEGASVTVKSQEVKDILEAITGKNINYIIK